MLIDVLTGTARTLDVSTRSFGRNSGAIESGNESDESDGRKISFLPSLQTSYTLWYHLCLVTFIRDQVTDGPWNSPRQTLQVQCVFFGLCVRPCTDVIRPGCSHATTTPCASS